MESIEKNEYFSELLNTVGSETMCEIIEMYLIQTPKILAEMNPLIASSDYYTIAKLAHKLKSSSLTLGANTVGDICLRLEGLGKDHQHTTTEIEYLVQKLNEEFNLFKNILNLFLSTHGHLNN